MLDAQKNVDDDRIEMLERMIREASDTVMESERKYEEVKIHSTLWRINATLTCVHCIFLTSHYKTFECGLFFLVKIVLFNYT